MCYTTGSFLANWGPRASSHQDNGCGRACERPVRETGERDLCERPVRETGQHCSRRRVHASSRRCHWQRRVEGVTPKRQTLIVRGFREPREMDPPAAHTRGNLRQTYAESPSVRAQTIYCASSSWHGSTCSYLFERRTLLSSTRPLDHSTTRAVARIRRRRKKSSQHDFGRNFEADFPDAWTSRAQHLPHTI